MVVEEFMVLYVVKWRISVLLFIIFFIVKVRFSVIVKGSFLGMVIIIMVIVIVKYFNNLSVLFLV